MAPQAGFAWSADSYQLLAYDADSSARMWWMRPARGQDVAELERKGCPMLPELAALVTPRMVANSGKAPIEDESDALAAAALAVEAAAEGAAAEVGAAPAAGAAAGQGREQRHLRRQWRPAFHPAFTLTGTQPQFMLPQVTGDVLRVTTRIGAPVLPGFGPSPAAQNAAASEAARRGGGAAARRRQLSQAAVDYLMPAQAPNPDIASQAVYRRHDAHVVLVAFLSDAATMLTVDQRGLVALWPASDADRSGFGWFKPKKCFQLPPSMRTCHARGAPQTVWPLPSGRPGASPGISNPIERARRDAAGAGAGGGVFGRRPSAAAEPQARIPYEPDAEDAPPGVDGVAARRGAAGDATGGALLESRAPWIVRYRTTSAAAVAAAQAAGGAGAARPAVAGAAGAAVVVREVLHRPPEGAVAGAPARALVVSTYSAATGELLARSKQRCGAARQPFKVVAAELAPSQRDLLLFCHVAGRDDDPDSFPTFSVMVLNLAAMRCLVPRIDAPDPSYGTAAPAYALTPALPSLGSEYLLLGLGAGMLGAFSLATGQLVAELFPGIPHRAWGDLEVFASGVVAAAREDGAGRPADAGAGTVALPGFALGHYASLALARFGSAVAACGDSGRTLLVAAPAGGKGVMDWTDVHYRQLARLISRRTWLWTEMVVDKTIIHTPHPDRFLWFPPEQRPLVLQLGGSDPQTLAAAAVKAAPYGYDEINLNCGCPSDRVAGAGCFGAALMMQPRLVAACMAATRAALDAAGYPHVPLSVKCRLGVDDHDSYESLVEFVRAVSDEGGVRHFIVHARKCLLKGLSPAQNRSVPPLRHEWVWGLKRDFPHLSFSLNGGLQNAYDAAGALGLDVPGLGPGAVSGVMIGRAAYNDPWGVLGDADVAVWGEAGNPAPSRREVLERYCEYSDGMLGRWAIKEDGHREPNARALLKPVLNLFHGEHGSKRWKAAMDAALKAAPKDATVRDLLAATIDMIPQEVLDSPPLPALAVAAVAAAGGNLRQFADAAAAAAAAGAEAGGGGAAGSPRAQEQEQKGSEAAAAAAAAGTAAVKALPQPPGYSLPRPLPQPGDRAAGEDELRRQRLKEERQQQRRLEQQQAAAAAASGGGGDGSEERGKAGASAGERRRQLSEEPAAQQQAVAA
ncbi:tRNA-dihydrouridine synthase A [Monoraphidium neglectum]|uniref:tRNA-dihydrouridine synthase A n=1 Tax=Monoraphidium neglectum TaxID=145388 RepID=A0A0D2MJQ7_9CHLO|nr:tRNA-dihydrouridine synthase A [Monoraphidium neglectum]KIZ03210.1 tRNA-dihydrouridine synthase A [Monoraphidium neglectum]|eukprot:XP_013902229.1 tRNA-dihydrouridine synthase A [Monoraphidium neglectum]